MKSPDPLPTPVQLIFLCSKVNGGFYQENLMQECKHDWPTATWFQRRREALRRKENEDVVHEMPQRSNVL